MGNTSNNTKLDVLHTRAGQLKRLRGGFLQQLFLPPAPPDPNNRVLNDIANSFSRFAAYQQTAFDSGASRSSSSNDANSMERQVQRAFNQVLGRATGGGASSFMSALNGAFPTTATSEGQQVVFTPTRSMVSLYGPGNSSDGAYLMNSYRNVTSSADGFAGTISARQANLLRQASVIAGDAMRVLDGLNPFVPEAEADQVDALRALIRSELNSLIDEFGRVDEPRKDRVLAYFSALKLHVTGFGRRAFLDDPTRATTVEDEAQIAGFELLKSYAGTLRAAWETFFNVDRKSSTFFSLSERVERANILLPAVAQVNTDFEAAMDSVGFAESERRSLAARFDTLAGLDLPLPRGSVYRSTFTLGGSPQDDIDAALPDITVYDLTEWIDRFANLEGPSNLADSGLYGLDFITDQADRIFWVIAPVVAHLERGESTHATASTSLEQILLNERVHFAINNLLGQLDSLADLSVPGANENRGTP
jgi:hypothetical protein